MSKVDLIEQDLWDHYSGLPSPMWYQYLIETQDEEDNTSNSINTTVTTE